MLVAQEVLDAGLDERPEAAVLRANVLEEVQPQTLQQELVREILRLLRAAAFAGFDVENASTNKSLAYARACLNNRCGIIRVGFFEIPVRPAPEQKVRGKPLIRRVIEVVGQRRCGGSTPL